MAKLEVNIKHLGVPMTIGELKKIIAKYDDSTAFGFRNMEMLHLYEVNEEFVAFQP